MTGLVLVAASVAVFVVLGVVSYAANLEGYARGFTDGRRAARSDQHDFRTFQPETPLPKMKPPNG